MPSCRARLSRPAVRSLSALLPMVFALALAIPLAQPAQAADTLTDALVKAYDNNPQLQAARAQLRATDEGVPQAKSGWLPTATANGEVGEAWANNNPGPKGTFQPRGVNLQVTQPLYTGDTRQPVSGGFATPGQVALQQDYPLPMQVLAYIPEVAAGDVVFEQHERAFLLFECVTSGLWVSQDEL